MGQEQMLVFVTLEANKCHIFLPPTHSEPEKTQHLSRLQLVTKPLYRHCVIWRRNNDKEHYSTCPCTACVIVGRVRTACLQQIKQGLDWFLSEEWIGNMFATYSIVAGSWKWPQGPVTFKEIY